MPQPAVPVCAPKPRAARQVQCGVCDQLWRLAALSPCQWAVRGRACAGMVSSHALAWSVVTQHALFLSVLTRAEAQATDACKRTRTHNRARAHTGHAWKAPMDKVLQLSIELSRAVSFLHNCNPPIIHRDLKPANLLLTASGRLKVCARARAAQQARLQHRLRHRLRRRVRCCAAACVLPSTQLEAPTAQRARKGRRRMQRPQTHGPTRWPSLAAKRACGAGA